LIANKEEFSVLYSRSRAFLAWEGGRRAQGWHEGADAALGYKNPRGRASRISVRRGNVELYI